jgi:indolepyruvate ferredoxin oxidoreductase alpha subunit
LGQVTKELDIAKIAAACGVEFIREVDPYDLAAAEEAARAAMAFKGPAVGVMRQECTALKTKTTSFGLIRICA